MKCEHNVPQRVGKRELKNLCKMYSRCAVYVQLAVLALCQDEEDFSAITLSR